MTRGSEITRARGLDGEWIIKGDRVSDAVVGDIGVVKSLYRSRSGVAVRLEGSPLWRWAVDLRKLPPLVTEEGS